MSFLFAEVRFWGILIGGFALTRAAPAWYWQGTRRVSLDDVDDDDDDDHNYAHVLVVIMKSSTLGLMKLPSLVSSRLTL